MTRLDACSTLFFTYSTYQPSTGSGTPLKVFENALSEIYCQVLVTETGCELGRALRRLGRVAGVDPERRDSVWAFLSPLTLFPWVVRCFLTSARRTE